MKRILLALAIVGLVCTSAHAGKIVSYNSSYGQQPRFISPPLLNGAYSQAVQSKSDFKVTFDDGCIRWLYITTPYTRTRTYNMGDLVSDETVAGEPDVQVLGEFCP